MADNEGYLPAHSEGVQSSPTGRDTPTLGRSSVDLAGEIKDVSLTDTD
jgi:hypothetical protein